MFLSYVALPIHMEHSLFTKQQSRMYPTFHKYGFHNGLLFHKSLGHNAEVPDPRTMDYAGGIIESLKTATHQYQSGIKIK